MIETLNEGRKPLNRVAIYCGASNGARPEYVQAARAVANALVQRGIKLVYGGGSAGLMGEVGRAVVAGLGENAVIGVIPAALQPREVSGDMFGDLRVVSTLHERKAIMAEEADAFIAIPGGFGTLDELLEMVTWHQLGFHQKPIGVLNVCGYFDHLLKLADHMTAEGFIRPASRKILQSASTPEELLDKLESFMPPVDLISILAAENKAKQAQMPVEVRL